MLKTVNWMFAASIALTIVCTAGCDPGFLYEPVNEQTVQIGDVLFSMEPWMTLIGSKGPLQGPTVRNRSSEDVILLRGQLITKKGTFDGSFPGDGDPKWRTIPPGETGSPFLAFEYGDNVEAGDVLGEQITFTWNVQVENEEHTIHFVMKPR